MNYHQYYPVDIVNGPGTRAPCLSLGVFMNAPVAITKALAGKFRSAIYQSNGRPDH